MLNKNASDLFDPEKWVKYSVSTAENNFERENTGDNFGNIINNKKIVLKTTTALHWIYNFVAIVYSSVSITIIGSPDLNNLLNT